MKMFRIVIKGALIAFLSAPVMTLAADGKRLSGTVDVHAPKTKGVFGFGGKIGPHYWGSLKAPAGQNWRDCESGHAQSPIDFSDSSVKKGSKKPIQIDYKPVKASIENLGTTIEVPYKNGSHITVDGTRYELIQFHLHTPSEHTFDGGAHFPLEIHFVHQAKSGDLAVLGVLVREGKENAAIAALGNPDELAQIIPRNENVTFTFDKASIDGEGLLPKDRSFYRYNGSLTTPPCSEIVLWSVFKTPIEMSAGQLHAFQDALGDLRFAGPLGQNNRPPQPLHGREVTINR